MTRITLGILLVIACVLLAQAGCRAKAPTTATPEPVTGFTLSSPAFQANGTLPVEYTCDGENGGRSPALAWTNAPAGTACLALVMRTLALDGTKWNWVLYNIPAGVSALAESTSGVGTAGLTSDGPERRYYPPCSQGPGAKTYTFTLFSLSGTPSFSVPADSVNGPILVSAIAGMVLDSCTLGVSYTRPSAAVGLTPEQWRDVDARRKPRHR